MINEKLEEQQAAEVTQGNPEELLGLYNKDIKLKGQHLALMRYLGKHHDLTPSLLVQKLLVDEMARVSATSP